MPIRSSITAWNRSRPKNVRSTQAKRHGVKCSSALGNRQRQKIILMKVLTIRGPTRSLRCMMPGKFEVPPDNNQPVYTKNFRETCARINDDVKLFTMMTMNEDLERATLQSNTENRHRLYETERLKHLRKRLNSVCNCENLQLLSEAEKKLYVSNILPCIQDILAPAHRTSSVDVWRECKPRYFAFLH